MEEKLILQLQECTFFSLQLDESTDVTNIAQLLAFTWLDYHDDTIEEFLFCKPLTSNATAENIFNIVDGYLSEIGLPWSKCVGLCTYGAQAMYGKLNGLAARIKQVAPECKITHYVIYREALASKN